MSTAELKRSIKRAVDLLPQDELKSLADYAAFLARRDLMKEIQTAEKQLKAGKGVKWRAVLRDV